MGRARIPQNWATGDALRDVTISMPDDPEWRGLLVGYFHSLGFIDEWDESTEFEGGGPGGSIDLTINASADDAHVRSDQTVAITVNDVVRCDASPIAADRWNGGFRFPGVTIPQGAAITSATITIQPTNVNRDDPNVDIFGELSLNAVDFVADPDMNARPRTVASVLWDDTDLGEQPSPSPDISTIIEEIVGQGSWVSGNALVIFFDARSDFVSLFRMDSWDGDPLVAARLQVTYGGAPGMTREDAVQAVIDSLATYVVAP